MIKVVALAVMKNYRKRRLCSHGQSGITLVTPIDLAAVVAAFVNPLGS
jgi:hypothetical protein